MASTSPSKVQKEDGDVVHAIGMDILPRPSINHTPKEKHRTLSEEDTLEIAKKACEEQSSILTFWAVINTLLYALTLVCCGFFMWFAISVYLQQKSALNSGEPTTAFSMLPKVVPYSNKSSIPPSLFMLATLPLKALNDFSIIHIQLPKNREALLSVKSIIRDNDSKKTHIETDVGISILLNEENATIFDLDGTTIEVKYDDFLTKSTEIDYHEEQSFDATRRLDCLSRKSFKGVNST